MRMRNWLELSLCVAALAAWAVSAEGQRMHPTAVIVLEKGGEIQVELFPDDAPKTVESFIALSKKGFYDGLTFHRVVPGFVAQGGDPKGDGTGGARLHAQGRVQQAEARPRDGCDGPQPAARLGGEPILHLLRARPPPGRQLHGLRPGREGDGGDRRDSGG